MRSAPLVQERTALAPVAVAAAAAGGLLLVHMVDPNQPGNYPTCPWLLVTGTFCPGCGTLRAMHALTNGDLGAALAMNPLAVVMVAVLAAWWVAWAARTWTSHGRARAALRTLLPSWVVWGYLVVVLAYWLARNLPGMGWLAPS